ncbi:MAG TPA: type II CAAX endopeptidase family protein [Candidatus Methylomirabilis sp.]|nr:type II CAAX endopeptidase family protein [Candidatus Methylomirabilis sp.]
MSPPKGSRAQIVIYLVSVFAFSSFFYFLILHSGSLGNGRGMYVLGLMWCPALAGMATLRLNGRSISDLGWKWGETKYQIRSWFIPLLYAFIAYAIVWVFRFGGFPNQEFLDSLTKAMHLGGPPWVSIVLGIVLIGVYGVIRSIASALGEEIGWRGFLVPELSKTTSFTTTALISGVVWSLWHYPVLIYGDYNAGTPTWYGLTCFTVMVIADSFIFAWMRLKSGSLWTGAILHASHNLYIQGIFTPITRNTGKTAWYIDELGCVLPLVVVVFAIYFWSKRRDLPAQATMSAGK